MKKLLFIFTLAATLFFGCSKDEEEIATPESLNGTSWVFEDKYSLSDGNEVTLTQTFAFKETTYQRILLMSTDDNYTRDTSRGTYTYQSPSVTINISDTIYIGTVSLNTMNLLDLMYTRK